MTVGIRGMGLIGGSFEKAFRKVGHEVVNLKGASHEDFGRCEMVIVCLPPLLVAPWVSEHAGDFAEGTIIVDAAGVKTVIVEALEGISRNARWTFVGGHPMAGKEQSGYANSEAELFRGASMILTPYAWTSPATVERLKAVFAEIGFGQVVITDPRHHDEMIAYTSQLAHVVSSAYIRDELAPQHNGYSAGSFQDMTRVATVDPEIWKDLFLANGDSLAEVLGRLIERLTEYHKAIVEKDEKTLTYLLAEGRKAKMSTTCTPHFRKILL